MNIILGEVRNQFSRKRYELISEHKPHLHTNTYTEYSLLYLNQPNERETTNKLVEEST